MPSAPTGNLIRRGTLQSAGSLTDFMGRDVLSQPHGGDSSVQSPFHLVHHLARTRASGMLTVRTAEDVFCLGFKSGKVVCSACESEPQDVGLARLILAEEDMRREKLLRACSVATRNRLPLSKALFEQQMLDPKALVRHQRSLHTRFGSRLLSAEAATFSFIPATALPAKLLTGPAPVPANAVLRAYLAAELKHAWASDLDAVLAPLRHVYLFVAEADRETAGMYGYGRRDVHAMANLMDGMYKLDDVVRKAALGKNAVTRLLFSLGVMGLLKGLDVPTRSVVEVSQEQELETRISLLMDENEFEQLGVHWSTPPMTMRKVFTQQKKEYGPGGRLQSGSAGVARLAQQLWQIKEAAYSRLRDAATRTAIRAKVVEPVQMRYSAELLYNQSRTAEVRAEWEDGRELLEMANELSPEARFVQALKVLDGREAAWRVRLREKELAGEA